MTIGTSGASNSACSLDAHSEHATTLTCAIKSSADSSVTSSNNINILSGTISATTSYATNATATGIYCGQYAASGGETTIEANQNSEGSCSVVNGILCSGNFTHGTNGHALITDDVVTTITNGGSTAENIGLRLSGSTSTINIYSGTINTTSGTSSKSIASGTTIVSLDQYATLGALFAGHSNLLGGSLTCNGG